MKEDIVIFHGLGCNAGSVWIPWAKALLEEKGHKVHAPSLPNPENPNLEDWIKVAEKSIAQTENPLQLIGHSLGGTLILHLLSKPAPWQERLQKALLFGAPAFTGHYVPEFASRPLDWEEITKHSSKLTAIWSRDDDRVPEEHIRIIEENTEAHIEIVNGHQHFKDLENPLLL